MLASGLGTSVALESEIVERALENKCLSVCWCCIHAQFQRLLVCRSVDAQVDTGHPCETTAPFQIPDKSHAQTRQKHNTDNKLVDVSATATHPGQRWASVKVINASVTESGKPLGLTFHLRLHFHRRRHIRRHSLFLLGNLCRREF